MRTSSSEWKFGFRPPGRPMPTRLKAAMSCQTGPRPLLPQPVMLSNERPGIDHPGGPGQTDELACLTEGIYAYLLELDGWRSACQRHEGMATVDDHEGE